MKGLRPLSALVVILAAGSARAQEIDKPADRPPPPAPLSDEAPAPRYPPTSTRYKVLAAGLALTGGAWGLSYYSATSNPFVPGIDNLKIPVVGPWIALGHSGCSPVPAYTPTGQALYGSVTLIPGSDCGAAMAFRGIVMVLDGLVQLGGIGLLVQGIVMKTEAARPPKETGFLSLQRGGFSLRALPVTSPTMTGLGLVGTF